MADPLDDIHPFLKTQIITNRGEKMVQSNQEMPIEEVIEQEDDNNQKKGMEQIKINRQKLFNYLALTEKKNNICPQILKEKQTCPPQSHILAKTTHFNKSPSHKNLKIIKHKITPNKIRLKTCADKENIDKPLFPKSGKKLEPVNFLNKTTSSVSFKAPCGSTTSFETKDLDSTKFSSKNTNQSGFSKKSSTGKFKITSHNKSTNSFKKNTSLSKFRYLNTHEHQNQMSVDHSEVMSALNHINQLQEQQIIEKKVLQDKIKELRSSIEKQQGLLEESIKNRQKMITCMNKQEQMSRYSLDGAKIFKRKFENCQIQTKQLQNKYTQAAQVNQKVVASIDEEKQLISMYQSVIEELRGQLKIEKQVKLELQKKVILMKKTMKSAESKANAQQTNTRDLFQKIFISLDKWQ